MIRIALIASIVVSIGSFAWGYWQAGFEAAVRWISIFGLFWLLAYWRKWRWFPVPAVFASLLLAAFGVWFEFHSGWMFNGAAFALIAYDLGEFERKLAVLPPHDDIPGRTRRHLTRIALLALCAAPLFFCFVLNLK